MDIYSRRLCRFPLDRLSRTACKLLLAIHSTSVLATVVRPCGAAIHVDCRTVWRGPSHKLVYEWCRSNHPFRVICVVLSTTISFAARHTFTIQFALALRCSIDPYVSQQRHPFDEYGLIQLQPLSHGSSALTHGHIICLHLTSRNHFASFIVNHSITHWVQYRFAGNNPH
jgi:hypothetical protein